MVSRPSKRVNPITHDNARQLMRDYLVALRTFSNVTNRLIALFGKSRIRPLMNLEQKLSHIEFQIEDFFYDKARIPPENGNAFDPMEEFRLLKKERSEANGHQGG